MHNGRFFGYSRKILCILVYRLWLEVNLAVVMLDLGELLPAFCLCIAVSTLTHVQMTANSYHYIKIMVVCPSAMEGQWKRFDLETQGAVSLAPDQKKLQLGNLCEC